MGHHDTLRVCVELQYSMYCRTPDRSTVDEKRTLNNLSSGCSEKPGFLPKHFGNPKEKRGFLDSFFLYNAKLELASGFKLSLLYFYYPLS